MSSALKALKKLRKKAAKHESKIKAGDRALRQLSHPTIQPSNSRSTPHLNTAQSADSVWSEISQQVVGSVLSEAAKPLKPLLDWFEHSGSIGLNIQRKSSSSDRKVAATLNFVQIDRDTKPVPAILRLPFKSPPCKRCPARSGGICQCAAKRFA